MSSPADNARAGHVLSRDLPVGTRVRYKPTGEVSVLARRKKPGESDFGLDGWWIDEGVSGLADRVLDDRDSAWEVLDG